MDTSTLQQQIPIALLLVFVQNFLKQQTWFPLISYNSAKMNHIFAIIAAGAATVGIHFTFNSADHSLMITGLSAATIGTAAWHWLQQYILSKTAYTALQAQLNPPMSQQPQPVVVVPASKPAVDLKAASA